MLFLCIYLSRSVYDLLSYHITDDDIIQRQLWSHILCVLNAFSNCSSTLKLLFHWIYSSMPINDLHVIFIITWNAGAVYCVCWMHLNTVPAYPSCYFFLCISRSRAANDLPYRRQCFYLQKALCVLHVFPYFSKLWICIQPTVLANQRWYSNAHIALNLHALCAKCIYILFQQILVAISKHIRF